MSNANRVEFAAEFPVATLVSRSRSRESDRVGEKPRSASRHGLLTRFAAPVLGPTAHVHALLAAGALTVHRTAVGYRNALSVTARAALVTAIAVAVSAALGGRIVRRLILAAAECCERSEQAEGKERGLENVHGDPLLDGHGTAATFC